MNMEPERYSALIVAYYLSRYDQEAYRNLGYGSTTETHARVGQILGVNPNSVKNMRDEFDPLHPNPRAGWYQRPLRPSRAKVVELFQDMDETELHDFVSGILANPKDSTEAEQNTKVGGQFADEVQDLFSIIGRQDTRGGTTRVFTSRVVTGRKAEDAFIRHFEQTSEPVAGILHDVRDTGCGYDFEIEDGNAKYQIEVKGMQAETGGILLTSKEWHVAQQKGNSYFLAIFRRLSNEPIVQFVRNPARRFTPKKQIATVVQIRWQLDDNTLRLSNEQDNEG